MAPSSTTFPHYSTGALEGVEFIETCVGTMGPYSLYDATYSYEWPLFWNGTSVSASGPDAQDLSFSATGHRVTIRLPCSEIPITIYGLGPATATKVTVLDASLPSNFISIRLEPAGKSGNLRVYLAGTSQKTLVNTTYSSGDHTIGFGNLGSYSTGQIYDRVVAEWTVEGETASGSLSYEVEVLGSYSHTRYNTPNNDQCGGSSLPFCYFTGGCIQVNSCTSYGTANGHTDWFAEIAENGSGHHAQLGFVSQEYFCGRPGSCSHAFRNVSQPCAACSGHPLTSNGTVAIMAGHARLSCGSRVFVEGVGVRTVTDHGGGLVEKQLDHYAGVTGCDAVPSIGQRMTFRLF